MKTCRVCGRKTATKKPQVCPDCINVKYFKCFCCEQRFSFEELTTRNLDIGSQYKCTKPRMQQLKCAVCQKYSYILANYNMRCLHCINKNTLQVKLDEAEKNLLIEYERKVNTNQQLAMSHNTIQIMFGALKRINDPIAERVIIHGYGGLLNRIQAEYSSLDTIEARLGEYERTIAQMKSQIISLQSDMNKFEKVKICYNAAKTFMLCGLRPEVSHYIPRQIQQVIAKLTLREFFVFSV